MGWYDFKHWLATASGLNMDALHVHAGIGIQLVIALLLRRSLRSPLPWLAVLVAIVANEYYDLHHEIWPSRSDQWAESAKDFWNTMLLPTLLLLIARFAPHVLTGTRRARSAETTAAS
jgi:hypothetical protein